MKDKDTAAKATAETQNLNAEEAAAQNQALAEEIARLREELNFEREARVALEAQVAEMSGSVSAVATSININPPEPAPIERPLVEIDGQQYRFKAGAFRHGGQRILAADVAANADLLGEIFGKFPGLFEQIG
jgi:hypothetical protein